MHIGLINGSDDEIIILAQRVIKPAAADGEVVGDQPLVEGLARRADAPGTL